MDDKPDNQKAPEFSIPYPMIVAGETEARNKTDFWRFRMIANILRQTPKQIEQFEKRYNHSVNETVNQ